MPQCSKNNRQPLQKTRARNLHALVEKTLHPVASEPSEVLGILRAAAFCVAGLAIRLELGVIRHHVLLVADIIILALSGADRLLVFLAGVAIGESRRGHHSEKSKGSGYRDSLHPQVSSIFVHFFTCCAAPSDPPTNSRVEVSTLKRVEDVAGNFARQRSLATDRAVLRGKLTQDIGENAAVPEIFELVQRIDAEQ
jgi:hypothetical protein